MMIGSGIFSSPGLIVALTGSVGASLLVWLVGGLLAWTGASSYAELGAAIPLDGGTQVYLSYAVRINSCSQAVVIISFVYIEAKGALVCDVYSMDH
jgi:amino acid transporter